MAKKQRNPSKKREQHSLVFISHATYDKWIATVLCEKLESLSEGVRTFRDDRDIAGGDSIPDAIQQAIRDCDELVVLLTPESVARQWVLVEIGMAAVLGRRIVPILYHVEPDEIPGILAGKRAYHLHELDQYIADVRKRTAP